MHERKLMPLCNRGTQNNMQRTDQELIAAYLAGDSAAFDVLVLRYLKLVFSVVLHYVKNVQDAEDISQDVFVKVLRNIKSFDQTKSFKPWVLQIGRNASLDWLKKKKPLLASELETEMGEGIFENIQDVAPLADEIASQHERLLELQTAMNRLSAPDRLVVQLRYLKQLSFKEIADELHEVLDTVKSRHRRALLKLRKILGRLQSEA